MTVSTFFPDGDEETTSVDGYTSRNVASETFATLKGGNGDVGNSNGVDNFQSIRASTTTDEYDRIQRGIYLFDTSGLPDIDLVSAATLEIVITTKFDDMAGLMSIVVAEPAVNTTIATSDYQDAFTFTKQATDLDVTGLNDDSATYNVWTLNSTGRGNISLTSISKFGCVSAFDADNSAPTWGSTERSGFIGATAEEVLTGDKRPKLVVTHAFNPNVTFAAISISRGAQQPELIPTGMRPY